MKKFINFITGITAISTCSSFAISCASKPVESIKGISNKINISNNSVYDIMKWNSDVISNANYKTHFIINLENCLKNGGDLDYLELISTYQYDTSDNKKDDSIIYDVISDYQDTSNQGEKITTDDVNKNLIFTIYGVNDDDSLWKAKTIDNTNPTITKINNYNDDVKKFVPKYNSDTNAYVMHFEIGVEASTSVANNPFIGARYNIKKSASDTLNDDGSISANGLGTSYYANVLTDDVYNNLDKTSKNNLGIKKESDGTWSTGDFNYMFDIEFYFTLS